ncbi:MAG: hypothetical protein EP343_27070 [Deltaproteobacteria bacterium]|nr:MAG: hypothetical protein EP343_27070 [Deltaproteobacteria bacterium]
MTTRRMCVLLFLATLLLQGYTWKGKGKGKGNKANTPPPPFMFLAKRALQKGNTQLAIRALRAARACWTQYKKDCGFRYDEYRSVEGVLYLSLNKNKEAAKALADAAQQNAKNKATWFYLGQARFRLKQYKQAALALQKGYSIGKSLPGYFLLLSRSLRLTRQYVQARRVLQQGQTQFPKQVSLQLEEGLLHIQLKQYNAVFGTVRKLQKMSRKSGLRLLLLAEESLRRDKTHLARLSFLEKAHLLAPQSQDILERLAYGYAQANNPLAAARWYSRLGAYRPKMHDYAAQFFAQAGQFREAFAENAKVPNLTRQQTQRGQFWMQQEEYLRAISLLAPLFQAKKLKPAMRYRLAYAGLKTGKFKLAKLSLDSLMKTKWSRQAKQLLTVLRQCQRQPLACQ